MSYQSFLELVDDLVNADKREQSPHLSKLAEAVSIQALDYWHKDDVQALHNVKTILAE